MSRVLAPYCTATSKATRRRCERRCWTGVCIMHGGAAAQVRKRGPMNKALAEAQAAAAANGETAPSDPFLILRQCLDDLNRLRMSTPPDSPIYLEVLTRTLAAARVVVDSRSYSEWTRSQSQPALDQAAHQFAEAAANALRWVLDRALATLGPAEERVGGRLTDHGRAVVAYRDELSAWATTALREYLADEVPSAPAPPSPPVRVPERADGAERAGDVVRAAARPGSVSTSPVGVTGPAGDTSELDNPDDDAEVETVDAEVLDDDEGERSRDVVPASARASYRARGGTSPHVAALARQVEPWSETGWSRSVR